jgi:hypothetical protein
MADGAVSSESEKKKEDWMNSKWRPMMGWMYMVICTMDMVIFPILWSLLQAVTHTAITQWNPLTLQGAGLFHIAMGAVLGIAAFGRTQEKLNGANNGGAQTPAPATTSAPTTGFGASPGGFGSPAATTTPSSFGGGGFGSTPPVPTGFSSGTGFGAGAAPTGVTSGFGGKAAPPPQVDPVL